MTENNKPFAMSIKKLHIIYFSPGGTTEKTVRTIASGMEGLEVETIDLLPSDNRKKRYVFGPDDLVVFGCMTASRSRTFPPIGAVRAAASPRTSSTERETKPNMV